MTSAQAASTHGFPAAWPCAAGPSRALGRWTQPTLPVTTSPKDVCRFIPPRGAFARAVGRVSTAVERSRMMLQEGACWRDDRRRKSCVTTFSRVRAVSCSSTKCMVGERFRRRIGNG